MRERITSQKKVISDILKNNKKHPTAENIFLLAKKKLPQISKGTVYRILNDFQAKGKAEGILHKGVSHFDGDTMPHAHFICQKCYGIFDIFEEVCRDCRIAKNKKTKVGKINNYKINFYGCCKKCS